MTNPIEGQKLDSLVGLFIQRGWTFGFAESCTGGLLSAWVAKTAGISKVFNGSVVSYARHVKESVLNVPSTLTRNLGEVSEPVALAMAHGACEVLQCDWSVAITGIAGPTGGSLEKPVGMVCFAVVGPGFEKSITHLFPSGLARHEIQEKAAVFAFDLLLSGFR